MKKKDLKGKLSLSTEKLTMLNGINGGFEFGSALCNTGPIKCPFPTDFTAPPPAPTEGTTWQVC